MKLLNCHIENFGVLSDFTYTFQDGLNIIHQPNGFGKSTFAAFLKAMLYGFPRTGARSAVDNERKRFDPWQGGKYGGFLEFEYEGTAYRVTRYFGKTAAKDTFSLTDLTNRCPSDRFSPRLGEELFQLDGDSFARSTYLPQSAAPLSATASIRAKLSDLVDNTNDLNNYDTALTALRQVRSTYKAYRGSGGQSQKLAESLAALEEQRYAAGAMKPRLEAVAGEIETLNAAQAARAADIQTLRERIRLSAQQAGLAARQKQLADLRADRDRDRQALADLDARYPMGCPTSEELKAQQENLIALRRAEERLNALTPPPAEAETEEQGCARFPAPEQAAADVDACQRQCNELDSLDARLAALTAPEEAGQLAELNARFAAGVPDPAELDRRLADADALRAQRLRLDGLSPAEEDLARESDLAALFAPGVPEEEDLAAWAQAGQDLALLARQKDACRPAPEEEAELQALSHTFAAGVPTEEEVKGRLSACRRIAQLNGALAAAAAQPAPSKAPVLLLVLGALLALGGILAFALGHALPGALLLVAGVAGGFAGLWLRMRTLGRGTVAAGPAEEQELAHLQQEVNDFLLRFYPDAAQPEQQLSQLLLDRERFLSLNEKRTQQGAELARLDQAIEGKNRLLRGVFARYYPGKPYDSGFLPALRQARGSYLDLCRRLARQQADRDALADQVEAGRADLAAFLRPYFPGGAPEDPAAGLRLLAADAAAYRQLTQRQQEQAQTSAELRRQRDALASQTEALLSRYDAYDPAQPYAACLQQLRHDLQQYRAAAPVMARFRQDRAAAAHERDQAKETWAEFCQRYALSGGSPQTLLDQAEVDARFRADRTQHLTETEGKLAAFLAENPDTETQTGTDAAPLPDPGTLEAEEKALQADADAAEARLRALRQERDALRRTVEQLPEWDDQAARLAEEQQEAERKSALLDRTMELLSRAKDNLANSYVGKLEQSFTRYADELLNGRLGRVMVDKDLQVHIDEQGAARDVGFFSAGMADGILLCMRMALIDALFTKERPFLILDDPFVNLDDDYTPRALALLRQLAQQEQVVYLVCNSSRC